MSKVQSFTKKHLMSDIAEVAPEKQGSDESDSSQTRVKGAIADAFDSTPWL